MLTPIQQEPLIDQVEKSIYTYLKSNSFSPGDSFPGEKELAEMLQVSRPVIREGLSRLRMLGLLKSRKRRGMIVSKPTIFETMKKVIDPCFLNAEEQQDFCNLRLTIELGLADLLVANITERYLSAIEVVVSQEEKNPGDFKFYMDCDYKFHALLYKATGSKMLESFQLLLYRFFSDLETRRINLRDDFSERFNDPDQTTHRDILEAIKVGDPEHIHHIMRKHLGPHLNQGNKGGKQK